MSRHTTNRLQRLVAGLTTLCFLAALPAAADNTVTYVHTDPLGSPVAYTNEQGVVIQREYWNISYRIPEGFNPFTCMDTVRGLVDAIHHFETEGPGTDRIPSRGDRAGLVSLLDELQHHTHQLHEYFIEIENSTTLELPRTNEDLKKLHVGFKDGHSVREEPALYLVR